MNPRSRNFHLPDSQFVHFLVALDLSWIWMVPIVPPYMRGMSRIAIMAISLNSDGFFRQATQDSSDVTQSLIIITCIFTHPLSSMGRKRKGGPGGAGLACGTSILDKGSKLKASIANFQHLYFIFTHSLQNCIRCRSDLYFIWPARFSNVIALRTYFMISCIKNSYNTAQAQHIYKTPVCQKTTKAALSRAW